MDTLDHGNYSTYYNKRCRCEPCKEAARTYTKSKRSQGLPPGDPRHGSRNGYFSWGCRCDDCTHVAKEYTESRKDRQRDISLTRSYGLSPQDWDKLFQSQGSKCASCGDIPREGAKRKFHLDHDHSTGAVRGILCHSCNVALGHLKEDQARIQALSEYLALWKPF